MPNPIPEGPFFDLLSRGRRGPGRQGPLTPSQLQQIARTVARTPEVMVKVLPSGAGSASAVRRHLDYVGRQGDVELLTDDGQRLQERDATAALVLDWDLDLAEYQSGPGGLRGGRAPRLVHKVVFSMPAGTPPDKVLLATQGFCREHLALQHRHVLALHTDEPHPHVHVVIKAVSEQGERLNIRKATLREWREAFANHLRLVGVAANATPRVARGETRPRKADAIFRAARRGASTHMRERVAAAAAALGAVGQSVEPAALQLSETRRELLRAWHATGEALERQGHGVLAEQTRRFAKGLPPARTEREWLSEGVLEQARRKRPPEMERTR